MSFSTLSIRNAEKVREGIFGKEVLHVRDPHALIQAAGYLKFINAKERQEGIFFRGQTKLYRGLVPSLFRGIKQQSAQEKRVAKLRDIISQYRDHCPILQSFNGEVHEPLLQHYGLRTTWIDLVDNVWVALWFGCFQAIVSGKKSQYLHFERRIPNLSDEAFVYILLIGAELDGFNDGLPGYCSGTKTELVDLRMSSPSIFVRPHSQHGLLFRMKGEGHRRPLDYSGQLREIIRISLADALSWLGEGKTLNTHSLFPPPFYDDGYEFLLSSGIAGDETIGSIYHVGA